MFVLTKINLKEHCRTCLKQLNGSTDENQTDVSESKNLHFNITNDPELQQLICINVDGPCTNDSFNPVIHDYPENVCLSCYNKLYSFAIFRRRAQQSAEKLRTVLKCANIKVEIQIEDELRRNESVGALVRESKFQLNDATAEREEAFFETSVANLADVDMNENTVDPFSSTTPSISECSDNDTMELTEETEVNEKKDVKKCVVEKVVGKDFAKNSAGDEEDEKTQVAEDTKSRKEKPPKLIKRDKYSCPQCNEFFSKNAELGDHVNQVHALGSTPFLCDHCDKSYRNLRSLKEHVVQAHQDKIKLQDHFQCSECPKVFLDKGARKKHMGLHFTNNKTHVCGICSERFPVKKWLVEHLRTHTPDGRIPCAQCDKTYSRHQDLENHERSTHLKEKPHHCKICDKYFQNKQSFRIHNYRHSGKKPYLCDICGKDFRQRTAMKTHRSTHLKNDNK
ncbi:zinc finger protein 782-like [Eurosta solidaginis]|uniref:zinc finger protein 782-like n=1 Tax=Eurosta solidaginis TaxID=178769 RepID=UPI0035316464